VQERDGHIYVFLPPLEEVADAVALLGVVERAAAAVGVPVILEGYAPPADPRTRTLTVTPDPGVIEVNVHPAGSWDELVEITETLHRFAHEVGLGAETFTLDGTHTGTGGGNHITLGGATAKDSPLLRRPDLLVSMLTFWQHHPSLSYLFSGRFIGPTSQAPRVDEGRHETLYELEIAFAELHRLKDTARPWHVDRALRHLLTDITGNTHRSEFCVDKLFSPDSERGRLGLLELRGFEMPPHADMALVQALLVRALVARFWAQPYTGRLVRWGTRLHDSFLLPAFAAIDIAEVVVDLSAHGIAFEAAWLDPFLEFRFPRIGTVDVAGVSIELRSAVEPWHVLGEEMAGGGVARYVDSSVERVQVRVTGAFGDRYAVTCNGVPLRLHPVGDGLVSGVRFRAWAPPSALHPTIGVQSPLVFDLVDRWNDRSVGGCTYHVVHPGGRAYDSFPVNASEAEARRGARFTPYGHSPGPVDPTTWQPAFMDGADGEYPRTLDLRRVPARK
ncbi:MAG: transglutaminase family protein, partial [Pseudonocardiales bacterium]|nr:transglutaminase family protein [Pseudonocardiales bacterium]